MQTLDQSTAAVRDPSIFAAWQSRPPAERPDACAPYDGALPEDGERRLVLADGRSFVIDFD